MDNTHSTHIVCKTIGAVALGTSCGVGQEELQDGHVHLTNTTRTGAYHVITSIHYECSQSVKKKPPLLA